MTPNAAPRAHMAFAALAFVAYATWRASLSAPIGTGVSGQLGSRPLPMASFASPARKGRRTSTESGGGDDQKHPFRFIIENKSGLDVWRVLGNLTASTSFVDNETIRQLTGAKSWKNKLENSNSNPSWRVVLGAFVWKKIDYLPTAATWARMFESPPNLRYDAGDVRKFIEITSNQPEAVHAAFRYYYPGSFPKERAQRNKKEVQVKMFNKMITGQLTPNGERNEVEGDVTYHVPYVTSFNGVEWHPLAVIGVGSVREWTRLSPTDKAKTVLTAINDFAECGVYETSIGAPTAGLSSQLPAAPSPPPLPSMAAPLGGAAAVSTAVDVVDEPPFRSQFDALPALSPLFTVTELQKEDTPMSFMCMVEFMLTPEAVSCVESEPDKLDKSGWALVSLIKREFVNTALQNPWNQKLVTTIDFAVLVCYFSDKFNSGASLCRAHYKYVVQERRGLFNSALVSIGGVGCGLRKGETLFEWHRAVNMRGNSGSGDAGGGSGGASGGGGGLSAGGAHVASTPIVVGGATPRFKRRKVGAAKRQVMTYEAAAILREVAFDIGVSQNKILPLQALFYFFHHGVLPTKNDLRTRGTLTTAFKQLHEKDLLVHWTRVLDVLVAEPMATLGEKSDATHFGEMNMHTRYLVYPHVPCYFNRSTRMVIEDGDCNKFIPRGDDWTPRDLMLGIGALADKGDLGAAASLFESFSKVPFQIDKILPALRFATLDGAALGELVKVIELGVKSGVLSQTHLTHANWDDKHITAVVMKAGQRASFGLAMGIDTNSHNQVLYDWFYTINTDTENLMALLDWWAGDGMIIESKIQTVSLPIPRKPQEQRWGTLGECGRAILALRNFESKRFPGQFAMPHGVLFMASKYSEGSYQYKNFLNSAVRMEDPRILSGLWSNVEMNDAYKLPNDRFDRVKGANGYDIGFRAREFPGELIRRRTLLTTAALDPATMFPKTAAAIEKIATSSITFKGPGGATISATACHKMYVEKLAAMPAAMLAKFDEVYAPWFEAPLLFAWFAAPGYGAACARFVTAIVKEHKPDLLGLEPTGVTGKRGRAAVEEEENEGGGPVVYAAPDVSKEADKFFAATPLASDPKAKEKLVQWVVELSLYMDAERQIEIGALTHGDGDVSTSSSDLLVLELRWKLPRLDVWLFYNVDIQGHLNETVELDFSMVPDVRNANESQEWTDIKMTYLNNVAHQHKKDRMYLNATDSQLQKSNEGKKQFRASDTISKVIEQVRQLARDCEKYSQEEMAEITSHNEMKKQKTSGSATAVVSRYVREKKDATKTEMTVERLRQAREKQGGSALHTDLEMMEKAAETAHDKKIKKLLTVAAWKAKEVDAGTIAQGLPLFYRWYTDPARVQARAVVNQEHTETSPLAHAKKEVKHRVYHLDAGMERRWRVDGVEKARVVTRAWAVRSFAHKRSHQPNETDMRQLAGSFAANVVKRIWAYGDVTDDQRGAFTARRWFLRLCTTGVWLRAPKPALKEGGAAE